MRVPNNHPFSQTFVCLIIKKVKNIGKTVILLCTFIYVYVCLFQWGAWAHPIFSETGDFPKRFKEKIAAKSAEQGFFRSRLPKFTPEEVEYIRGTSDFFGLNHYSTYLVYRNESDVGRYDIPSFNDDLGNVHYQPDHWEHGASDFLKVLLLIPIINSSKILSLN